MTKPIFQLELAHTVTTHTDPTPRVMEVAGMFGLGVDREKTIELIPPTPLTLWPGQVVFITGASGGGKTTMLRLIREAIEGASCKASHGVPPSGQAMGIGLSEIKKSEAVSLPGVIDFDAVVVPGGCALVDGFDEPGAEAMALKDVLHWLNLAGLNDAFVMLRDPSELSAGQRYRLKLAHAMASAQRRSAPWSVVLADEFGAALDRMTAQAVARGVRKWATREGMCVVIATTHDDLLEALYPDVLIEKGPAGEIAVAKRSETNDSRT